MLRSHLFCSCQHAIFNPNFKILQHSNLDQFLHADMTTKGDFFRPGLFSKILLKHYVFSNHSTFEWNTLRNSTNLQCIFEPYCLPCEINCKYQRSRIHFTYLLIFGIQSRVTIIINYVLKNLDEKIFMFQLKTWCFEVDVWLGFWIHIQKKVGKIVIKHAYCEKVIEIRRRQN